MKKQIKKTRPQNIAIKQLKPQHIKVIKGGGSIAWSG